MVIRSRRHAEGKGVDPLDSLSHPLRREILCALVASEEPLPPSALATRIPGTSVSEVGYHARVLESSGAVGRTRAGGAEEDRYLLSPTPRGRAACPCSGR